MQQIEMKLKKTDKYLLKNGYDLGPRIMTPRMEHRFGRLMEAAHEDDHMAFSGKWPGKTGPRTKTRTEIKAAYRARHFKAITYLTNRDGWVTSKTLSTFTGLSVKGASNVLATFSPAKLDRGEFTNGRRLVYTLKEVK